MAAAPTYDDLRETGRFEILRTPTRFSSEIIDVRGSDVNVALAVSSAIGDHVASFVQQAYIEVGLSSAAKAGGEVLDRFVWDRYQLIRQAAGQAVVQVEVSRPSAMIAQTIEPGTVFSTDDGVNFESINQAVLGIGILGPISITVQAQVTGVAGNVAKGAIRNIVTRLTDQSITVTNPSAAAGGTPEETDEDLANRARDFFANARRGTREAIQNGSVTTVGVERATVSEDLTADGVSGFRVQAIIADANGQANSALAAKVVNQLESFRALGVPVRVIAGTPQFVDVSVDGVVFRAGSNTNAIIDQMRAQVVSAVNETAPGRILRRSVIFAALRVSDLVDVPDSAIVTPAGDLAPTTESGVIRTTSARVSINGQVGS